jgi:hypothetical protein
MIEALALGHVMMANPSICTASTLVEELQLSKVS